MWYPLRGPSKLAIGHRQNGTTSGTVSQLRQRPCEYSRSLDRDDLRNTGAVGYLWAMANVDISDWSLRIGTLLCKAILAFQNAPGKSFSDLVTLQTSLASKRYSTPCGSGALINVEGRSCNPVRKLSDCVYLLSCCARYLHQPYPILHDVEVGNKEHHAPVFKL